MPVERLDSIGHHLTVLVSAPDPDGQLITMLARSIFEAANGGLANADDYLRRQVADRHLRKGTNLDAGAFAIRLLRQAVAEIPTPSLAAIHRRLGVPYGLAVSLMAQLNDKQSAAGD